MSEQETIFAEGSAVSADGAIIGYRSTGRGPALVIAHGTFRAAEHYEPLARCLADSFTVHIVDRRGRGGSGPKGSGYSLRKEREDFVAVLRQAEARLLFGHSYGGLTALEAAQVYPLQRLALYEPAVSHELIPTGWLPAYEEALASQDEWKAFHIFLKGMGSPDIPDEQLEVMRQSIAQSPEWVSMVRLMPTVPSEVRAAGLASANLEAYSGVSAETLLLAGSESADFLRSPSVRQLERLLPRMTMETLSGLDHNAPDMHAPERVAQALKDFFLP